LPPEPEPTGWELRRQIERLHEDLKAAVDRAEKHVTESGLAALLARYDDRMKFLGEDIAEERAMRTADITAEREARKQAVKEIRDEIAALVGRWRWAIAAVALPVALFLGNMVFLIWNATR
jgi:anti-sigma-K factor RskA